MRRKRLPFLKCLALLSLILLTTITPGSPTLAVNTEQEGVMGSPDTALPLLSQREGSGPEAKSAPAQTNPDVPTWIVETVDGGGTVGEYTSLDLDSQQLPHISYYDQSNTTLKYAYYDGTTWHLAAVGSGAGTGLYTSLALDAADQPSISYLNSTASDLMYAHLSGTVWLFDTVDPNILGHTSLALDASGLPRISYYRLNNDLYYAHRDGGLWQTDPVASTGDVGMYNSLAIDSSGRPHISYYDATLQELKYASYNGSAWVVGTVDSTGNSGQYTSLALDAADRPHISYYRADSGDLIYAYFNGTSWVSQTVDYTDDVGQYSSLALDAAGRPHISYYNATTRVLKYAYYNGTTWVIQTVDPTNGTGQYSSLALDDQGWPHISYYRSNGKDLKYAYLCAPVAGAQIDGPLYPPVGETRVYTATYLPITSTQLVRAAWDNGAVGLTAAYSWTVPGVQTLAVTVTNACGQALDTLNVMVCQPVQNVQIGGPASLRVGEVGVYTAAYTPSNATSPVTRAWDNGTVGPTAVYSWTTPGTYTVTVTATNPCGQVRDTFTVSVCQPVQGVQIGGPTSLRVGETGVYTTAYAPPTATLPLTLTWNNGAVGPTAAYSWTQPGTHTVTVTATNPCSWVSATLAVTVCGPVTGADIAGPGFLHLGETGHYTASYSPLTATLPMTFTWDNGTVGPTAAYSWTFTGTYTITVTATNPCGQVSAARAVLVAASCDALEWVQANGPVSLYPGDTGVYTATYGPPTATTPVTFAWDNGTAGPTTAYSWTLPDIYTVTVTATNPCGDVSTTLTVTVLCRPLTGATIDGPTSLHTRDPGVYTASYSPLTATLPVTFVWDNGTAGPTTAYSWTLPGAYTITVTGTNPCNTVRQASVVSVTCLPVSGTAFTWTPSVPVVGEQVTFTGTASSLLPITFTWDLGGGIATGTVVVQSYPAAGTYPVAMTATNGCAADVVTHTLIVATPPPRTIYLPVVLRNWNPCFLRGGSFWEFEPNESPAEADANGSLCSGPVYFGRPDDANDYYYLVSGAGTISVTVSDYAPGNKGQMLLYNEAFTGKSWDPDLSDGGLIITETLGGKYYIRIYTDPVFTSTVPYSLIATFPRP
jgi:PKD repeat protein